jgi:hypothetical protein
MDSMLPRIESLPGLRDLPRLKTLPERLGSQSERQSFRLLRPRVQLRLALYVVGVSLGFAMLFAFNSWAAYGRIFDATLSVSPAPIADEIGAQTKNYVGVSLVLLVGYSLTVMAVTIAYMHRLLGPTVALERHVRALERGDYTSRMSVRENEMLYRDMAGRLNRLAIRLEDDEQKNDAELGLGGLAG